MTLDDYVKAYERIEPEVQKAKDTKQGIALLVEAMTDDQTVGYLIKGFGSPEIAIRYISCLQDETFYDSYHGIRKKWSNVKEILIRLNNV